ncbi:MAG: peptide chain release factor N(5)-glutamine methyltransferase [Polynucleobacter sp.]|nr:MAG: peptide chain release factor N(5)-glutamine methyltransferase [Polynucleobacter sp.]
MTHLISQQLGWSKSALISRDQESLSPEFVSAWQAFEQRRLNGEPVAYMVGVKGFYNIDLHVAPGVLIPRPETELLVECSIKHLESLNKGPLEKSQALDLGTGSGAIALAIAKNTQNTFVTAIDMSTDALKIAQHNAQQLELSDRVSFLQGSWFEPLKEDDRFDLIASNPPYIRHEDPHLTEGDLRFEPIDALTDHHDGLNPYRTIFKESPSFLKPGGLLIVEHGYDQSEVLSQLLKNAGFIDIQIHFDLAGIARALSAKLG